MRIPHFPKYVITGYPKKGWKLIPEIKRGFNEAPDVMLTWIFLGIGTLVLPPLAYRRIVNGKAYNYQFKDDYTVIRDTEVNVDTLPSYNPDELEAARKRTGLYQ